MLGDGEDLLDRITVLVSGRAGEELVLGTPSTGGEQDLEEATRLARDLVVRHGMSPAVGRARLVGGVSDEFLGGEAVGRAKQVLDRRRATLDRLVARLLEDESVDGEELAALLSSPVPAVARRA